MEFLCKTIINISAQEVFKSLLNGLIYPLVDKNIIKLEGEIKLNQKIKIYLASRPHRPVFYKVSQVVKNKSVTWAYSLPFNLFKKERTFLVLEKDDHTMEFQLKDEFSGLLVVLFPTKIPDTTAELKIFAKGLKKYLEHR